MVYFLVFGSVILFKGPEKSMVKKIQKIVKMSTWWHKMPKTHLLWKWGLTIFFAHQLEELSHTKPYSDFFCDFRGLRKPWSKKCLKTAIFCTFRCRQIGRRGLNRKTDATNRFFGPNYPPVQIFSKRFDKMSSSALWVFLYQYKLGPRKTPPGEIWAILNRRKYFKKIETMPTKNIAGNGNARFSTFLIF